MIREVKRLAPEIKAGVNRDSDLKNMIRLEVDGVITDHPGWARNTYLDRTSLIGRIREWTLE